MTRSPWRIFVVSCIVLASSGFVIGMFVAFLDNKSAAERDFIEYWAAGQQLRHHLNPYDARAILRLQRDAGLEGDHPKVTFSPPVVLFVTLPLGFVTPKTGLILWLLVLVVGLLISIWILWILNGRPDSGLHLCGYMFAPAVACLMAGQLGIFLLLGVVLFLYLQQSRPYLAGAALLPCGFKPHLFLPFFIAILLWSVSRKEYQIIAGFCTVLLAGCAFTLGFDPPIWSQYSQMMSTTGVLHAFVPTLSVTLRFLIDRNAVWLQFVPEIAACTWTVWYFWTRRSRWNWMDEGMLVLLVSAVCTPYAWFSDEAVLLPAVLSGVFRAAELGRSLIPIAVIALIALVEVSVFGQMASKLYLWTTPAWLAWYLYATWKTDKQPDDIRSDAEAVAK